MTPRTIHPRLRQTVQLAVTGAVLVAALFAGRALWARYESDPWTRDGRVRADIVQVAPDVAGLVGRVFVANDQPVRRGQPLFQIDRDRYALALRQAQGVVAAQQAALHEARQEAARNRQLGELVPAEVAQQADAKVAQGAAALDEARTARDLAALNLRRTLVLAPADGVLSDLTLRAGDYVGPGKPVLALIDSRSLRIEGYFEETRLAHVHVGQAATVRIMGESGVLHGHVTSIAAAIEDRDRTGGANLLPSINPTFSWVRLAQRVPVRIAIDQRPAGLALVAGRTAAVTLARDDAGARR
ncbi:MAG: HlyD family secretion protein [Sphingomonadales bacterium]|nr:HlyD family secretion protein [Sphingomonadales bacterium]